MKALAILCLVFGLGATGVGLYSFVETTPRYKNPDNVKKRNELAGISDSRKTKLQKLEWAVLQSLEYAYKRQQAAIWGLGVLGLLFGLIVTLKKAETKLHLPGIGLSLVGMGLAVACLVA